MTYLYHVDPDGFCTQHMDSPALDRMIDREPHWYGTPEGAILHGGVNAVAFERRTEALYDAARWMETGELVQVDTMDVITITAQPKGD